MDIEVTHLGCSGLAITLAGATVATDPPSAGPEPAILTWTETERIAGIGDRDLAAPAEVLAWLGRRGMPLDEPAAFAGFDVLATPYVPIPYATREEAVRKALIGLRHPVVAARRLARTLRRPATPPIALTLARDGVRVALLGQALHRFQAPEAVDRLVERHGGADLLIAGADYDDEVALGRLAARFDAGRVVYADLIGPVRRALGLPTRPIEASLPWGPPDARVLREGETLRP